MRPKGVNPDLPVNGDGKYEWTGYLSNAAHPHVINPSTGYIVNWNNKPAKGFPASDSRWDEQSLQRQKLLTGELARQPSRRWPTSCRRPTRPPPRTCGSSSCGRRSRGCSTAARRRTPRRSRSPLCCRPGTTPAAAAATPITTARSTTPACPSWTPRGRASPTPGCATGSAPRCASSSRGATGASTRHRAASTAAGTSTPWKDLRALLGQKVAGAYHLRYCGDGSVKTCSHELWAALDAARRRLASQQGADPKAWRAPEAKEQITFAPISLITMRYTNKPTGIHQVMQFGP